MTPECPKGPEREARSEEQISWDTYLNACQALDQARVSASTWKMRAEQAEPEVERLTAEVERLQVELATIRGELADFAQESVPSHVSTLQAVRWLIAEHDEQVKHNNEVGEENRALCNERDEWKRAAEAETQGRQVEVSRLREQLAAQQPVQHKVRVTKLLGSGQSVAVCPGCREGMTGTDQEAEDWKDQHEADTLRPALTNESFISSQDEDAVLFAVAQDRVRRDKGERHTLEDVAAELERMDEGRPSGSGRLAPRSELDYMIRLKTECCASEGMTGIDCRLPKGHADWHSGRFDPTGEGYESSYPVCIQWPRNESDRCEPEQDAAQAARSEATPKMLAPDPAWPYREGTYDLTDLPSPSLPKEGEDSD